MAVISDTSAGTTTIADSAVTGLPAHGADARLHLKTPIEPGTYQLELRWAQNKSETELEETPVARGTLKITSPENAK